MVRLKDFPLELATPASMNFNSCMVRLKDKMVARNSALYSYFNSCMVRLKVGNCSHSSHRLLFQFLYGAIKGTHSHRQLNIVRHFNSCMVRLKG
ncbi:hypothetical protein SAMN05421747_1225 [Parapedobacter composti]|uniref:Uncharacterized protein n=1 Tax=Parapedobacter composti TaxID=623281 RepID=A0A1I1LJM2_9SPHI|nr:hypothetical protein SAMN05421747_1225 [Parapedobacter composti]